ncbi:MAG TPA: hypothetical protein DCS09_08525 [Porphyromonadaceae bacterium]|nr:hypothetical protein [Porphyromonadaceae bacterium]
MNNKLWLCKGWWEGEWIYLTHHVGRDKQALIDKVMEQAAREKFHGTIDDRLKTLGWVLCEVEFKEVV